MRVFAPIFAACLAVAAFGLPAGAQPVEPTPEAAAAAAPADVPKGRTYSEYVPPELRDIGIDEKPGAVLPLDLEFVDQAGATVPLRSFFDGTKPVVIQLGYFGCPQLCGMVSEGMVQSLKDLTLTLGDDYRVLYISFDSNETFRLAAEKRQNILREMGQSPGAAGLYLLTGSKRQINELTAAVGFNYKYVPAQRQFSHPAALMIATPDGRLSRYLYGVKFDRQTLRLSLVEASEGKIGNTVDRFLLTCFMFDGKAGKYSLAALNLVRAGGVLTVGVVGAALFLALRRERAAAEAAAAATTTASAGAGAAASTR